VQRRRVADLAEASEPFAAALARGSIGVAQAAELARAHANPRACCTASCAVAPPMAQ
jgi:hypothetical protein